jgi:hypothetical protein
VLICSLCRSHQKFPLEAPWPRSSSRARPSRQGPDPQSNGPAQRANCAARRTSYGDRFSYGRWACEAGSTESIRPVRRRRDTQSTGRALICFQMGEGSAMRTFQGAPISGPACGQRILLLQSQDHTSWAGAGGCPANGCFCAGRCPSGETIMR